MIKGLIKAAGVLLILFLLITGGLLIILQTERVKASVYEWLVTAAAREGIELKIDCIEGSLPFKWTLRGIHLNTDRGNTFHAESIKLRIALLPLLYRELSISYLAVHNGYFSPTDPISLQIKEKEDVPGKILSLKSPKLPLSVSVKYLTIPRCTIKKEEEELHVSIEGKGWLRRNFSSFYLKIKASPLSSPHSMVECAIEGNQATKYILAKAGIKVESTELFSPLLRLPFESDFQLQAQLEGSWDTWTTLLSRGALLKDSPPLKGVVKTAINHFKLPPVYFPQSEWSINRKWEARSLISIHENGEFDLPGFQVKSDLMTASGRGHFGINGHPKDLSISFELPQLSLLDSHIAIPFSGRLLGKFYYDQTRAVIEFSSNDFHIGKQSYEALKGSFDATCREGLWIGKGLLDASHSTLPLHGAAEIVFNPKESLIVKELALTAPETKIDGNLEWNFHNSNPSGILFAQSANLSLFQRWLDNTAITGNAGLEAHFKEKNIKVHGAVHDFSYKDLKAKEIVLDADLCDWQGKINLEAQEAEIKSILLSRCLLTVSSESNRWPFQVHLKGVWRDALDAEASGFFAKTDKESTIQLNDLSGFIFKKPFGLKAPFSVQWNQHEWVVNACSLKIDEGDFWLDADIAPNRIIARLKTTHFPIDLLLLAHPTLSLKGRTSIDAALDATDSSVQGRMNLLLEGANISQIGKEEPLQAKGYVHATLNQNILQLQSGMNATGNQFFEWTGTFPVTCLLDPPRMNIDKERPMSSQLVIDGKIEEIFDFINMGSHRISGQLLAHLFMSKNLHEPSIQGTIELQHGSYENEVTGTNIREIHAKALAQNEIVVLETLTGKDEDSGTVEATGSLFLKPKEQFPYSITSQLDRLGCVRFDTVQSNLSGELNITGNLSGALAEGNLVVSKAELEIPDELPPDIPVLPITYVNQPAHISKPQTIRSPLFPLQLNLQVTAAASSPGQVIVRGRGLRSEWQGKVHLSGTNPNISITGSLDLLRGEFAFSGKVFKLTQGEILMIDKPVQTAHLSLAGTLELSDVTVTAILAGPLEAPRLTFESSPHMPTSSILSRILFNKDISEVSPAQAVQLAHLIMTLSGGAGPDVLEAIRKSLGVDRLNIVSNANSDAISIQIGKYLTKGVMVTLSQGTDSSQIIVEVELKKGFIFQAENQPDQEGKFSLKWNRNY